MAISVGTYLPPWGADRARVAGYDEDAVTLAVEAGRQALGAALARGAVTAGRVVFVSRDFPLLEGGNSAALVAGLGLPVDTEVVERIGGAPATLDSIVTAGPGTLVIAADCAGTAGAGAVLVGDSNPATVVSRVQRSFPQRTRHGDGSVYNDDDPRMMREMGVRTSMEAAALATKPMVVAGLGAKDAAAWSEAGAPTLPTTGASSIVFALAALIEAGRSGLVAASEQAALTAANIDVAGSTVRRKEPAAQPPAKRKLAPGADIKLSLAAYDRAWDPKTRWEAGKCTQCGTLAMPPRFHCLGCGSDDTWELTPLPRTATIYTCSTIHVPVPKLESPYTLAVIECDDVDVRVLVHVTDVPAGVAKIGEHGSLVFRRVAMRAGVPDYGHAFSPDSAAEATSGGAR